MSKIDSEIARAVEILTGDPESPVALFVNVPAPDTDLSYLQMWFDYLKYMNEGRDHFSELINDGWLAFSEVTMNFEIRHGVWTSLRALMESALQNRLEGLAFVPRLEQYVETYGEHERENVRKLILIYLMAMQEKYFRDNLVELGEKAGLPKQFLYSLNDKHKLFADKVIEVDASGYSSDNKFFLHKDIMLNTAIFKIFAALEVAEKELVMLNGSPLLIMFDLMDDPFGRKLEGEAGQPDVPGEDDEDDEDEEDGPAGDAQDIERWIKELEASRESLSGLTDEDQEAGEDEEESEENEGDENDSGQGEKLTAYSDELEYFHNEFLWIKNRIEILEMETRTYSFDRDDQKKKLTIEQQYQKQKRICEVRLQKSRERKFIPRLEALGDMLKLSEPERNIIKILITNALFVTEKTYSGNPSVGDLLMILFDNIIDRIKAKKIFLKSSRLVSSNIIQLEKTGIDKNLFSCDVIIDNRLVEYLIGENYDISNYIEGSILYKPSTILDNVILPKENKDSLLNIVDHFPSFLKTKHEFDLSSVVEYGDSLVLLFVGPSGTGKTMLANALANYLRKKILIFNLNNRSSIYSQSYRGDDNLLSVLFREARMNEAVLFFDEAEEMLERRMNELLMEIEKHQGIVVFATNASFRIDEAMRRRINHIQHFLEPGPALRRRIWDIHLPASVRLDRDVDLDLLAQRFEINGGLIKNAVFAALARAVSENGSGKPVIKLSHLTNGASEQLRNKLFMSQMQEHKVPERGFESVILPEKTMGIMHDLANIEKARKVLTGEWGFDEVFPDHNGFAVLFHGPPGTGKTYTAEALAYETGKTLKIVNYAQVVSMWVGGTEKALEALFKEVADTESILLFDEADALFASRTGIATANDRFLNTETDVLLGLIERFNSIAILTTNYIENIDRAFFRRMQYIVGFTEPGEELRLRLWKTLCPPRLPLSTEVDFEKLASGFQFNGGDIKNVLIRAATKRAVRIDQNRSVTMEALLEACKDIQQQKSNGSKKIGFKA